MTDDRPDAEPVPIGGAIFGAARSIARTALTIRPVAVLPAVGASGRPVAGVVPAGRPSSDRSAGDRLPTRAATPVTWGAAIDVPADHA